MHIISAHAPQVGLNKERQLWDSIDELIWVIRLTDTIFLCGDLNGHVGQERSGYERIHGGQCFGCKL